MCTLLILYILSLKIIPVNMIDYRQQHGSVNPAGIIAPAIVATFFSTLTAIVYCKTVNLKQRACDSLLFKLNKDILLWILNWVIKWRTFICNLCNVWLY